MRYSLSVGGSANMLTIVDDDADTECRWLLVTGESVDLIADLMGLGRQAEIPDAIQGRRDIILTYVSAPAQPGDWPTGQ